MTTPSDDTQADLLRWACSQGMHVPQEVAARWTSEQYAAWCTAWPTGRIVVPVDDDARALIAYLGRTLDVEAGLRELIDRAQWTPPPPGTVPQYLKPTVDPQDGDR